MQPSYSENSLKNHYLLIAHTSQNVICFIVHNTWSEQNHRTLKYWYIIMIMIIILIMIIMMMMKGSIDGACFTVRGRGVQRVGAALEKARFLNVSSRHLGELRRYWSFERGTVVLHISILMLQDVVEHGHSVPCRWGAKFCNWSQAPLEANAILSTLG